MAMDLTIAWLPPFKLTDASKQRMTYTFDGLDDLPDTAGVYVFGRRHGNAFSPLYVGKATIISRRIPQQLNNNKLMRALELAPNGRRELLIGEVMAKRGLQPERAIVVVERGLIKLALAQGHDLVNVSGTAIRSHTVHMSGDRAARDWLQTRRLQVE